MKSLGKSGVLYIATGISYLHEAILSARRSREWCKNIPICLCTDEVDKAKSSGAFNHIFPHPNPSYSYRDKISPLVTLPFEVTLFLDTDAFLSAGVDNLFALASESDLAAAFAPVRHPPGWSDASVPAIFAELNTGVLLLKKSSKVSRLINQWIDLYDTLYVEHQQTWDQASFRSVVWNAIKCNRLKFLPFPPEANLRTPKPWIAGRGQYVYVIHGRIPEDEYLPYLQYINSNINRFRSSYEWKILHPNSEIFPRHDNPSINL